MKNLFRFLFLVLSLAIFLFIEPSELQAQQIDYPEYVQHINKEK
ncbi:MAG: hypothetical protein ACI4S3_06225 [Candidatus Gastranaerophilaceae bacterium]